MTLRVLSVERVARILSRWRMWAVTQGAVRRALTVSDQMELLTFPVPILAIERTRVLPTPGVCLVLESVSRLKRAARILSCWRMWAVTPGDLRRALTVSDQMELLTLLVPILAIEWTCVSPSPGVCLALESVGQPKRAARIRSC